MNGISLCLVNETMRDFLRPRRDAATMFFMPYAADLELYRFPGATVFICLLCAGVYYLQTSSADAVFEQTEQFCEEQQSRLFRMALKDATGEVGADACAYLMLTLYQSDDRQAFLSDVLSSRKKSRSKLIEE